MKFRLFLLASVLLFACSANAQSPFKRLPKLAHAQSDHFGATVTAADSVFGAIRFITNIAAYAEPGNVLEAGAGIGYQKLDYSYATGTYYCKWSVSGMMWAGGSVAPTSPTNAVSFGIMLGVLNNLIMVGPAFNNGHLQATVAIGISLNN